MNPQKYSGAWPFVLVVVMGIYGYWAVQRELVSSRPSTKGKYDVPPPVPTPGVRTFHSRMWEDPLSSAYDHWKFVRKEDEQASKLGFVFDWQLRRAVSPQESPVQMDPPSPRVSGEESNALHDSSNGRYNDKATTDSLGFAVPDDSRTSSLLGENMKVVFGSLVDDQPTVCMPVFVPGDPYAEDKERRMRIRYAVVSGLAESGYHLEYPRRMSYLVANIYVRTLNGWMQREIIVPVKLFRFKEAKGRRPQVLVLWINESELGQKPLIALHRLLNEIFSEVKSEDHFRLKIIGPASSGTLEKMADELKGIAGTLSRIARSGLDPTISLTTRRVFQLLEAISVKEGPEGAEARAAELLRATLNQLGALLGLVDTSHWFIRSYSPVEMIDGFTPLLASVETGGADLLSTRATKKIELDNEIVKLHRVIGSDAQLAETLARELHGRRALPGKVVLITEHDTAYGRAFPTTFEKACADGSCVKSFDVLRGIDGQLPGDVDDSKQGAKRRTLSSPSDFPEIIERPPEGRTQYDYLKRLRHRIEQLGEVQAIGVVGSDVYDKLLVLRALKPHFPGCIFFTTDLDAIYSHPDELPHTRNLLIASHFDLRLHDDVQRSTSPFRDSYQSSTFLATRLACHSVVEEKALTAKDDDYTLLPAGVYQHWYGETPSTTDVTPVLHVVGRTRTYPLPRATTDEHTDAAAAANAAASILHPKFRDVTGSWHYFFAGGLTFFGVGLVYVWIHRDRLQAAPRFRGEKEIEWFDKLVDRLDPSLQGYGRMLGNRLNLVIAAFGGWGVLLALVFCFGTAIRLEAGYLSGGYSTWPSQVLYSVIGAVAFFAVVYLLDEVRRGLHDTRNRCPGLGELASRCFTATHAVKAVIVTLVVVLTGGMLVFELSSPEFIIPTILLFAGTGVCLFISCRAKAEPNEENVSEACTSGDDDRPKQSPPSDNLILDGSLRSITTLAIITALVILATGIVCELTMESPHVGWHPVWTSFGSLSRFFDRLVTIYAFAGIGFLLSTLLFFHLWCREFSRHVTSQAPDFTLGGDRLLHENEVVKYWRREHDRIWCIGRLTSVTGRLTPLLMGLLLLFVVAYHPWLSPTPMPLSLVVITTLSVIVFIASALGLRWHFDRDKEQTLERLRRKIQAAGGPLAENLGAVADEIASISNGVFRSWNRSPIGWILGGGTTLALVDLWMRWWTIGL